MDLRTMTDQAYLLFDGAMGTMLQQRGLATGALPELMNLRQPEVVIGIHREYVEAGAQVISANTFQAHELKLEGASVEEVVAAGVGCARDAGARFVALDVGPTGKMLEPMGTLPFERAYEVYRRLVVAGRDAGADLILIETLSDLLEAKIAVLAAKENCDLPVLCTMTFQEDGRTFMGCDPLTAAVTLQGLGVDALGVNCSTGPAQLGEILAQMLPYASVPVMAQPNAGLPVIRDGETAYDIDPERFAQAMGELASMGVSILGGCCGTTPEHIRRLAALLDGKIPRKVTPKPVTACTSGSRTVLLDGRVTPIGERINPTGKPKMKEAIRKGNLDYLLGEALSQVDAGAEVLDVNVGLPDIDEPAVLSRAVREIQGVVTAPLQIDSADPAAIGAALRVYNGKAIVNSVNGKAETMDKIFPLVRKYGALVVCLTLDEEGIPPTAEDRLRIARRICDEADRYGIPRQDLIVDCLVLTAAAQQEQVGETLRAIGLVKRELGCRTTLGVSNVSFGLPRRDLLNASFLAAALGAGLDAPILNPLSKGYRQVLDCFRALNGQDKGAAAYIAAYSGGEGEPTDRPAATDLPLRDIIRQGRKELAGGAVQALLESRSALSIIDGEFIPALNEVGRAFEAGELFLPQLMQSAGAVQNGFAVIKAHVERNGSRPESRGTILLATVQGDIHDIGKNIVKMMLENYGFEVVDLGKDVPIGAVVDAIRERGIRLAGLSALMTTTVKSMKETIAAVREAGLDCAFFVGGAVLSEEYARFVGADHYAKDAMESVTIAESYVGRL